MANYLYNGHGPLPALPEWDNTTYPYAVITDMLSGDDGDFSLFVVEKEPYLYKDWNGWENVPGSGTDMIQTSETANFLSWDSYQGGAWEVANSGTLVGNRNLTDEAVRWVNFDMLDNSGELYIAASDPIPITAPVIDPLSMWMGWKAGNWVARQRGKA